jgi:hypothetical protein
MLNSVCVLMSLFLMTRSTTVMAACTLVTVVARLAATLLLSSAYANSLFLPNGPEQRTFSCCSDRDTPTCRNSAEHRDLQHAPHRTLLKPCCISAAVRLFFLFTSIDSNALKKLSNFDRAAVLFHMSGPEASRSKIERRWGPDFVKRGLLAGKKRGLGSLNTENCYVAVSSVAVAENLLQQSRQLIL